MIFMSDEVDLLMKRLNYIKVLRVEIALPLRIEHIAQDKLAKSVREAISTKDLLMKGITVRFYAHAGT